MENVKNRDNQSLVDNAKNAQSYYQSAQSNDSYAEHMKFVQFKSQNVNSYDYKKRNQKTLDGHVATMIAYRDSNDVEVQFEDGVTTVCTYYAFKNGLVKHPSSSKIGERAQMRCGMWAEVVAERKYHDVDVRFDNGVELQHVSMGDFRQGLLYPSTKPFIGEKHLMSCEQWAKIVGIKSENVVAIRFSDGTIVRDVDIDKFRAGKVKNPNVKSLNGYSLQEFSFGYYLMQFFNFKKINKGDWKDRGFDNFELDFYHPQAHVAFEQDGNVHKLKTKIERDVIKNEKCQELGIQMFRFRDEECPPLNSTSIDFYLSKSKEIVPGLIDCKFELEEALKLSKIPFHPNLIDFRRDRDRILDAFAKEYCSPYHYRVGETKKMKDGSVATIISYISSAICKVRFENNTTQYCSYGDFFKGDVVCANGRPTFRISQRF